MFKNIACVFISPNEFLTYNDSVAGLFSDFRMTANAGIHLHEDRVLDDEEIDRLLKAVQQLKDIEERPPTEEELRLIDEIQVFHPEVRYVVKSIVMGAKGRKRLKKKKEKQRLSREEQERKEEKVKVSEEEKQRRREELEERKKTRKEKEDLEKKDKDDIYKQLRSVDKGEKEYEGWQGMLMNMFDFFANPELSKSQRLALRRNKQRLLKDLRRNYRNFQKIEKQLNENRGLVEFLDKSVEEGVLDTGTLAGFTELIRRDPDLVKVLDLPDINEDEDYQERNQKIKKFIKKNDKASLQVDLDKLKELDDIEDYLNKPAEEVVEYLEDEFIKIDNRIKPENITILVDEDVDKEGGRIITVAGPLWDISLLKVNLKLKNKDLYNKSYWKTKAA